MELFVAAIALRIKLPQLPRRPRYLRLLREACLNSTPLRPTNCLRRKIFLKQLLIRFTLKWKKIFDPLPRNTALPLMMKTSNQKRRERMRNSSIGISNHER